MVGTFITNAEDLAEALRGCWNEAGEAENDLRFEIEGGFHETNIFVRDTTTGSEYSITVKRQSGAPTRGFYCPECYAAFGTYRTDCMQHMVEAHGYDPDDADMEVRS